MSDCFVITTSSLILKLVHDRLIVRRPSGILVRRLTAEETIEYLALYENVLQLVTPRQCYTSDRLATIMTRATNNGEIFETGFAGGSEFRSGTLRADQLAGLCRQLMANIGGGVFRAGTRKWQGFDSDHRLRPVDSDTRQAVSGRGEK